MRQLELMDGMARWGAPERVALVTSVDAEGRNNLIAVGWAMRASMSPPVMAVALGRRSHTCASIAASGEFVFAVPGADLAEGVVFCGTHSGREVDKFARTGWTARAASQVRAPLVAECLANLECRVVAVQEIGDHRVYFGQVLAVWDDRRQEGRPLLIVGDDGGYETLFTAGSLRLGAVSA